MQGITFAHYLKAVASMLGLIPVCMEPSVRERYLNIVRVDKTKLGILNDLPFVGGILGHNLCLASLQTC